MYKKHIAALQKQSDYCIWGYVYDDAKILPIININVRNKITVRLPHVAYIDYKLRNLYRRIDEMESKTFQKCGISKKDVLCQILFTQDTIKSLIIDYGDGHSDGYFRSGNKKTEYVAHAFENAFLGNIVFKKYLPEIYEDMVNFVKQLK
jgi:hypothetical protein